MAGGLLHIFELGAVFQCRGDEGGAHRVRRLAAIEPERRGELAHHAVDGVRVHGAAFLLALAAGTQQPEHRTVEVGAMPSEFQIGAQPRRGMRVDGERVVPAALADHPQRVTAAVLVPVADREGRDFGAPQPDLQADRLERAITHARDRIRGWSIEHLARLRLGEGEGRSLVAIDCRARDLGDRAAGGFTVADQVHEQTRQRGEPPADRRRRRALALAHEPLPRDHRLVVDLAQLGRRRDRQCAQEVRHIAPVGAAGAGALLAVQPDFFLRDGGEGGDGRGQAVRGAGGPSGWRMGGRVWRRAWGLLVHVINRIITCISGRGPEPARTGKMPAG